MSNLKLRNLYQRREPIWLWHFPCYLPHHATVGRSLSRQRSDLFWPQRGEVHCLPLHFCFWHHAHKEIWNSMVGSCEEQCLFTSGFSSRIRKDSFCASFLTIYFAFRLYAPWTYFIHYFNPSQLCYLIFGLGVFTASKELKIKYCIIWTLSDPLDLIQSFHIILYL